MKSDKTNIPHDLFRDVRKVRNELSSASMISEHTAPLRDPMENSVVRKWAKGSNIHGIGEPHRSAERTSG